jgi:hypothetical protein
LVTLKTFTALDPIFTFPKTRLLTEVVRPAMPVPLSATCCGLVVALSVSVNDAECAPTVLGENPTPSVHEVLGAIVTGIAPHVPALVTANSAGSVETALETISALAAPVLVTVRFFVPVWPTATLANASEAVTVIEVVGVAVGVAVTLGVAVPVEVAVAVGVGVPVAVAVVVDVAVAVVVGVAVAV